MANIGAPSGDKNGPPEPSPFGAFGQSNNAASVFGGAASTGNANPSPFSGNAAAPKPLFGTAPTSGIFGGQNQSNVARPVFGSGAGLSTGVKSDTPSAPASATTPSFGLATPSKPSTAEGQAQSQSQTPSLFGKATLDISTPTNNLSPSLFGTVSTTPAGPPPASASGGLFGSNQSAAQAKPLFGAASSTQPAAQAQSAASFSMFGNKDTSSGAGSPNTLTNTAPSLLFGSKPSTLNTTTPSSSGGKDPISSVSQNSMPSTSTVFGQPSQATTSAPSSASLFGPNAVAANPFGGQQQSATSSAVSFGKPQEVKDASSGYGNTNTDQPKSSPFTLGSTPLGSSSSNIFGGTAASQSQSAAVPSTEKPSIFGNPSAGPGQTADLFSKASDLAVPKSADIVAPINPFSNANNESATKPNFFGNLGAKKVEPAATSDKPGAAAEAIRPSIGTTPALKGANTQGTGTADSTASTTGVGASGTNLGSSTAGPAPAPQSRLKNKSMDEIITRWASDLSKYQKEFQTQAAKVSSWDRALVQNSNDISKLYSRTFQAERDTAEVQKQLSVVEGHQDELEQWLDRYEKEVDELMARQIGQGEGLQGPDQERERTYKTAEKVSDRLNEMSKDLTSMIDEINNASVAINKTSKPDDPLSQIVRILNGHLSQLQTIDQSAVDLQAKVAAVEKDSQALSWRGQRGFGNSEAIEDFYKSYRRST